MKLNNILFIILVIVLIGACYFLYDAYQNINSPSQKLTKKNNFMTTNSNYSSYTNLPQYYSNMRFAKRNISYFIQQECSNEKQINVYNSMLRLEKETGVMSFYSTDKNNAMIEIQCNEYEEEPNPGEYFIAGEGGPTEVINSTKFNIITKGKVLLFYKTEDCPSYSVEFHELLHVLGFEHSSNEKSIMYNISSCEQEITSDIIDELKRLYSIPEIADLYFSKLEAVKTGIYLNFNLEVMNAGLGKVDSLNIEIYGDDKFVKSFNLSSIDIGQGRYLEVENVKLNSRDTTNLKFIIKNEQDLDLRDNEQEMSVQ